MTATGSGGAGRSRSALPDLVYPVKPVGSCDELRYSLRSVATNAAGLFRKVWVVVTDASTLPEWLTGVEVVEAGSDRGKAADVRAKITAATGVRGVASRFVLMNDDSFLVDPITDWPTYHMGPTSEYVKALGRMGRPLTVRNSSWVRTIVATAEWMAGQGHGDVLCRQGHRPLLWDRERLAATLAEYPAGRPMDVQGLYDAAGAAGEGERGTNAKVTFEDDFLSKLAALDIPWLSSSDRSFREGMIGGYIRGMFRTPSGFERAV